MVLYLWNKPRFPLENFVDHNFPFAYLHILKRITLFVLVTQRTIYNIYTYICMYRASY